MRHAREIMSEGDLGPLRSRFYESAFIRDLGIELVSVSPGEAVTRLTVQERFPAAGRVRPRRRGWRRWRITPRGLGLDLVKPEQTVLTVEFKINLLNRPAVRAEPAGPGAAAGGGSPPPR